MSPSASLQSPRRLILGVTGGIAAYKAAELVRLLVKRGIEVQVVLTTAGARFVGPVTFQALSGQPVLTDLWASQAANAMDHIELSRGADGIVVAPATADFLARLAQGRADDLLATLCLAREGPLLVAPAMNRQMWDNPATRRNVERLARDGVEILGPAAGDQACGETGMGRMLEPEALAEAIEGAFQPKRLAGRRVLLTAGPTLEAIDPVRVLTNLSSGRMGFALARAAAEAGARATLVAGPTALPTPYGVERVDVVSAAQMLAAVQARVEGCEVFFAVAAVADYAPARVAEQKIKKTAERLAIELERTTDILGWVASRANPPFCVGFAAETGDLDAYAEDKRRRKNLPLVVGNRAQAALGAEDNEVVLYDAAGRHPLPRAPKLAVAREIVRHVAALLA